MFDWLFPNWSNPLIITVLIGFRTLFNVYLSVMVFKTVGLRTVYTAVMCIITLLSGVLTVLLLRPSGLGLNLSYVEFILQAVLIAIAGYVVYSSPWSMRRIVAVFVIIGATVLLVVMMPIYGERFVAP